jgi:hypothetical protein
MPAFISDDIGNLITLVLAAAGVGVALFAGVLQAGATVYPYLQDRKRQKILQSQLSRGLYDIETIRLATRYYVRPKISFIDPSKEFELRQALTAPRKDLFVYVDQFLVSSKDKRHLLILADSGTGKTSFVLNYFAHNSQRKIGKRSEIVIMPLGIKGVDELIAKVSDAHRKVIFLDALDEDIKAQENLNVRIFALIELCKDFKKIIITCRTQFFSKDDEIPLETGIMRLTPRQAGAHGNYVFQRAYLSPFDDRQVSTYIRKRYPFWRHSERRRAMLIAKRIPLLSVRPMLLAHIPDLLERKVEFSGVSDLYEVMVDAWIDRETAWPNKADLKAFSELIAVELYVNREYRGMERIPYIELQGLAKSWGISLQPWQISSRSLLNRDADGNFKFAHRSIMEYLFVKRLIEGDVRCFGVHLTDQMKKFIYEQVIPVPSLRDIDEFVINLIERADYSKNMISSTTENADAFVGIIGEYIDSYIDREVDFLVFRNYDDNFRVWRSGKKLFKGAFLGRMANDITRFAKESFELRRVIIFSSNAFEEQVFGVAAPIALKSMQHPYGVIVFIGFKQDIMKSPAIKHVWPAMARRMALLIKMSDMAIMPASERSIGL